MDDRLRGAVEILSRIRTEGRFASDVFREAFAGVPTAQRGAIADLVYGVLRNERLLDRALALDSLEPTDRARAALLPVTDALLRKIDLRDPIERIAILGSLPDWLALRMKAAFGDEAEPFARSLSSSPPQTLRANRSKIDRDALILRLAEESVHAEPTKLSRDGLTIIEPTNPFRLNAFREGLFEVQDEGSQLIAELVAPPPKSAVLDFCAGAGGKTLHLCALLEGRGRVIAHDISEPKLEELRKRARRAGCSNVETRLELDDIHPVARVLVDAPCSGLGVLRRNPELRLRLEEASVSAFPTQQLALLERAASWVANGGRLIYSTCTFMPEENDQVVQAFLQKHPEFEIAPAKEILSKARAEAIGDGTALRLFPHVHGTDAFFAIAMRRKS